MTPPRCGGAGRARAQSQALVALRRAARVWPALNSLLHKEIPDEIILLDDEVRQLLAGAADRLAAKGVPVHWPKELARQLVARVAIGGGSAPRDMPGFLGGNEALRFDWQVALGDDPLTKDELEQLAQAHRPIVRLREQWQLVDADLARRVQQRELTPLNPLAALGLALTGTAEIDGEQIEVVADGWLAALRDRIADAEGGAELLAQPPALAGLLRDYQLRGLRWLARMTSLGLGCCLADDMGLGKTITVIALHLHRAAGPTLVVCPASLLGNWEREIRRFAPGVPVRRFHGSARDLADVDGFVLTTYGTMRLDAEELGAVPWDLVVADEAQHVKNARSATAKALRTIKSGVRVALTGTPVENTLFELWAILDWATPGLLGSQAAFRRRWAKPIEADKDEETARRLARLLRPFLLRRGKSDPGIAPELPAKTETDQLVPLTREQAGLYEAVVRETLTEIAETDGMARRGLIIKLLTSLKQICNHPAQYLKQTTPGSPAAPASSPCSTSSWAPSSPRTMPCSCSPSTWPWPSCSPGTWPSAACPASSCTAAPPSPGARPWSPGSRTARCRSSSSRSRPAAPASTSPGPTTSCTTTAGGTPPSRTRPPTVPTGSGRPGPCRCTA
ncbi:hypothetical protein GCM10018954_018270 [Kutzneria kofuensis]